MSVLAWFRPKPSPPPQPDPERVVAALCGYTPEQWRALTERARRECRDTVAWRVRP